MCQKFRREKDYCLRFAVQDIILIFFKCFNFFCKTFVKQPKALVFTTNSLIVNKRSNQKIFRSIFEELLHPSAKILPLNPCINQKNSLQKVAVLEGVFSNPGNPLFWRIFAPFCQNFTSKSLYKSKKFTPESSCFEKFKI